MWYEQFGSDKNRLYLAGFSQGGSFAHSLAANMLERFAAIATVSSWMTGKEASSPISSLHLHSADDKTVPPAGRPWWQGLTMEPQDYTRNYYRAADEIKGEPEVLSFSTPKGDVRVERSVNQQTGREFEYVTVQHEGHQWFGGKGDEKSPVDATKEIWNFFERHTKQH